MTLICSGKIIISQGENKIEFLCEKGKGHVGRHKETGTVGFQKYVIYWEEC